MYTYFSAYFMAPLAKKNEIIEFQSVYLFKDIHSTQKRCLNVIYWLKELRAGFVKK